MKPSPAIDIIRKPAVTSTAAGIKRAFFVFVAMSVVLTGVVLRHPAILQPMTKLNYYEEDLRNRPSIHHARSGSLKRQEDFAEPSPAMVGSNHEKTNPDIDGIYANLNIYDNNDDKSEGDFDLRNNEEATENQDAAASGDPPPNDGEDPRPWLILHVGPPKSATTTIQHGLVYHGKELAEKDNFWYMGQYRKKIDIDLGPNANKVFKLEKFDSEAFLETIKEHRDLGHNVVLSAEQYTSQKFLWKRLYKNKFLHSRPSKLQKLDLNQTGALAPTGLARNKTANGLDNREEAFFGFRVKVVVAYRHFFEWLPSMYYQTYHFLRIKPDPENPENLRVPGIIEYTETFLDKLVMHDPGDGGASSIYTTADLNDTSHAGIRRGGNETSHGSLWAYLKWSSMPELWERVDILDLHQQTVGGGASRRGAGSDNDDNNDASTPRKTDVFADFVCQSLPSANHTCSVLAREQHEAIEMRSSETKHFVTVPDRNRITAHARTIPQHNKTFLWGGELAKRYENQINKWFRRQNLGSKSNTRKSRALTVCLPEASQEKLKLVSWGFLRQMVLLSRGHAASRKRTNDAYYRSLFRSSTPTDHLLLSSQVFFRNGEAGENYDEVDDSWMGPAKAAHDKAFDAFLAKGKLCELNIEKLFENEGFTEAVFGGAWINKTNTTVS